MDFYVNDKLDAVLRRYYATFSLTLDTSDYVPSVYNRKILRVIFRFMKKDMKRVRGLGRRHRRVVRRECKRSVREMRELGKVVGGPEDVVIQV